MIRRITIALVVWALGTPAIGLPAPGVDIYLLADASIELPEALKVPLVRLDLQEKPWIPFDAVKYYDWSSHVMMLTSPPKWGKVALRGTPFVVVAGGERCYLGALWTMESSFAPESSVVLIQKFDGAFFHPNALRLSLHKIFRHGAEADSPSPFKDPRLDPRIRRALEKSGKLRLGIECTLDEVQVVPRPGGSTARYTFTVKNLEGDPLYVLDPDRLGTESFHYMTNGIVFAPKAPSQDSPVSPSMTGFTRKPEAPVIDALSLLRPGASMRRTLELPVYSTIKPGAYDALFWFRSVPLPEKDREKIKEGRVWIGMVETKREMAVKG